MSMSKALVAYAVPGTDAAEGLLLVGPGDAYPGAVDLAALGCDGVLSLSEFTASSIVVLLRKRAKPCGKDEPAPSNAVLVQIPLIDAKLSKSVLDGLQLWADDVSQLLEGLARQSMGDNASWTSSGTSNSRRSRALDDTSGTVPAGETILKAIFHHGKYNF